MTEQIIINTDEMFRYLVDLNVYSYINGFHIRELKNDKQFTRDYVLRRAHQWYINMLDSLDEFIESIMKNAKEIKI